MKEDNHKSRTKTDRFMNIILPFIITCLCSPRILLILLKIRTTHRGYDSRSKESGIRDMRDMRDIRDVRDIRDMRDIRDVRGVRDMRDVRDTRDMRDMV